MSATLGALLRLIEPGWSVTLFERLDGAAVESSDPWNNAGTGHTALCELNYTPERPDGSIDITRAVNINEEFQVSRQFWAYAAENSVLSDVRGFLNPVPHVSFVHGAGQVDYLRRCRDALVGNPLFASIEFIDDPGEFARRLPLMARNRDFAEPVAMNWSSHGTDVDFGSLSKQLIGYAVQHGTSALFGHEVRGLRRESDGTWTLKVRNNRTGAMVKFNARFVFVGAGGGALRLLQKSGIPEAKGFGGFPIGGKFLRTANPTLTAQHRAKVYGVPAHGAPKMSAPHLDLRIVNGKSWLLFGPFVGWSPKFLKQGHGTDLPLSVRPDNVIELLTVGVTQMALLRYLVGQLLLSAPDRVEVMREFVPSATLSDWQTTVAGQRVQVIRPAGGRRGQLEFGSTTLRAADGSIAGVLGASPGASTAVHAILDVLKGCFPDRYPSWLPKLTDMIPSLGVRLSDEPQLFEQVWDWGTRALGLGTAETDRPAEPDQPAEPTAVMA
jgi:malate dehydrogenase (quinone)